MPEKEEFSPEEIEKMKIESDINDSNKRRSHFANEAKKRGLIYKADDDAYIDENGNLLDAYGDRM